MNGQYAFSLSGFEITGVNVSGFFFVGGSFTADGNGNLTTGILDLNDSTGVSPNLSLTGSYSISADGRGSATFTTSQGTSNFRFVVLSPDKALITQFDTFAVGDGSVDKQDPSAFTNLAMNGGYSFVFDGISDGIFLDSPMSVAGRFTADGVGGISAGVEDINDSGFVDANVAFTGTYDVASTGRGTATFTSALGTSEFSFYVVSPSRAHFVSLDVTPALVGIAEGQQSSSFSDSSVSGDYAFLSSGRSTLGPFVSAGRLTADGLGGIDAGVSDENDAGTVSGNVAFTGIYNISSNGRGTATFTFPSGDSNFAFYMVSSERVLFVQTDSFAAITSGALDAQQGGPFSTASFSGNYGFLVAGPTEDAPFTALGQLTADGSGTLTLTIDGNEPGFPNVGDFVNGTYAISSNGRGTLTLIEPGEPDQDVGFFLISSSRGIIVGVVPDDVLIGIFEKQ